MRMQSQFFDDCNNLSSMGIPSLGSASFGGMPSGTFFQVIPSNNSVVDNTTEMGGLVYANSMDFPLLTHRSSGRIDVFSSLFSPRVSPDPLLGSLPLIPSVPSIELPIAGVNQFGVDVSPAEQVIGNHSEYIVMAPYNQESPCVDSCTTCSPGDSVGDCDNTPNTNAICQPQQLSILSVGAIFPANSMNSAGSMVSITPDHMVMPSLSPPTSPVTLPASPASPATPMKVANSGPIRQRVMEDEEWSSVETNVEDSSENSSTTHCRTVARKWSAEECRRLKDAVASMGKEEIQWGRVAHLVKTRNVSQCINKWKNELCKEGKRVRWTEAASRELKVLVDEGLNLKQIEKRMPEYSYIQLYQQIQKLHTNKEPWAPWEFNKLVELKKAGMGDTEIGRHLSNRHRDDVKKVWNQLRRERQL